jgi:hypothetical protein
MILRGLMADRGSAERKKKRERKEKQKEKYKRAPCFPKLRGVLENWREKK